jgi:hypothetical protein
MVAGTAYPLAQASETWTGRDAAGIRRMLAARSSALLTGDKSAFMKSVVPGPSRFRRQQARLFARMAKVPLASYRLTVAWSRFGDLARASDRARYPAAEAVTIPVTEERYRIRGFDDPAVQEDLFYTFIQENGRWFVAGDADLNELGFQTARHLWDFGPIITRRSRHFMLITHPCSARIGCAHLPPDVLDLAEQALTQVDSYWRRPWRHRIVILAPTTTAELRRMLQATFDVNKFVAFAYASEDLEHGLRFVGRRIILNWRAIASRTSDSLLTILAHELTHVATRTSAGPEIPTFIDEGIAEHVGYDGDPSSLSYLNSVVQGGNFDGKLPRDYQFVTGSGRDIFLSYQKAEAAIRFFIERWGLRRFVRFYSVLGRQRIVPGTPRFHLEEALHRTTGLTLSDFQKRWASSLRK